MSHVPWRDESELIGSHQSYKDAFYAKKSLFEALVTADKQHAELERALQLAQELREQAETVDPPEDISDFQLDADADEANIGRGLEPINEAAFSTMLQSLNAEQRQAFDLVMNALEHEDQHLSSDCDCDDLKQIRLFVSGVGGTGKSHVIDAIRHSVQLKYGGDGGCEKAAISVGAPTGISALNVSGSTLHRLLKLPFQQDRVPSYSKLTPDQLKVLRACFKAVRVLIVDEISMVSNIMLYFVDGRLREVFGKPDTPFGGLHIILFGDLLQLRPVNSPFVFEAISPSVIQNVFGGVFAEQIWDTFEFVELVENMRQKGDPFYINLLSDARVGNLSHDHIEALQNRILCIDDAGKIGIREELGPGARKCTIEECAGFFVEKLQPEDPKALCMMSKVEPANKFNDACTTKIGIIPEDITAYDVGGKKLSARMQKAMMEKIKASDCGGLEESLKIGIGSRVMLRRNISQEKKLVNGSIGTVTGFRKKRLRNGKQIVSAVSVQFDDVQGIQTIERVTADINSPGFRGRRRHQFPLCLAYCITIHKSQGLSLSTVMLDIGPSCFDEGMGYVGLSRCRELKRLFLMDFAPNRVWCDERAVAEYNRLRRKYNSHLPVVESTNRNGTGRLRRNAITVSKTIEMEPEPMLVPPSSLSTAPILELVKFSQKKNSCFADATLHALFALTDVWSGYPSRPGNKFDKEILRLASLRNTVTETDSMKLRKHFGGDISRGIQCDVWDLIPKLLNSMPTSIKQQFVVNVKRYCKCLKCSKINILQNEPSDFINPFIPVALQTMEFKSFIKESYCSDQKCSCSRSETTHEFWAEYQFPPTNKYVLVGNAKFGLDNLLGRRITDFHSASEQIGQNNYKLVAAVQHLGATVHSGHYVCFLRDVRLPNQWVKVDGMSSRWLSTQDRLVKHLQDIVLLAFEKL